MRPVASQLTHASSGFVLRLQSNASKPTSVTAGGMQIESKRKDLKENSLTDNNQCSTQTTVERGVETRKHNLLGILLDNEQTLISASDLREAIVLIHENHDSDTHINDSEFASPKLDFQRISAKHGMWLGYEKPCSAIIDRIPQFRLLSNTIASPQRRL
jgi:hypothetical protein